MVETRSYESFLKIINVKKLISLLISELIFITAIFQSNTQI